MTTVHDYKCQQNICTMLNICNVLTTTTVDNQPREKILKNYKVHKNVENMFIL